MRRRSTLLEKLLGPATVVVKNGGVDPKLYMNYRLKKPAESADESKKLEFAAKLALTCEFAAKIAGVIASYMRVPRLDPQLCQIIDQNPGVTVDLDVAVRILVKTARNGGNSHASGEPHPPVTPKRDPPPPAATARQGEGGMPA